MTAPRRFKLTAPAPREYAEQVALFRWAAVAARLDPRLALLYAIPNGMATSSIVEAVRAKKAGLRAGVLDACLPVPSNGYHGLYLELKRRNGVPSDVSEAQAWWIGALTQQGYKAVVAFGWLNATAIITEYLTSPPTPAGSDFEASIPGEIA